MGRAGRAHRREMLAGGAGRPRDAMTGSNADIGVGGARVTEELTDEAVFFLPRAPSCEAGQADADQGHRGRLGDRRIAVGDGGVGLSRPFRNQFNKSLRVRERDCRRVRNLGAKAVRNPLSRL